LDNLLAYIILLAPGLIIMLINERIGSHPSVKYTNTEKLVMSVLFSVPVLICNLALIRLKTGEAAYIGQLKQEIQYLSGLIFFSISSILFAIGFSFLWNKFLKEHYVIELINKFRRDKEKCDLNEGSLVWEDAFHVKEPQAVMAILKDEKLYGSPINGSEGISDERCLLLSDSKIVEDIVITYNVPIDKVYLDTKSGVAVKIYNSQKFQEAFIKFSNNES
jgi:hypothetical protein